MSPWVRIDENALDHPKILCLSDGAFRLWVQGLAHCQKFLTDGFIGDQALRTLRAYSPKRKQNLVDGGLWEVSETGIRVHDFLQWNESREHVMLARELSKQRMRKHRTKRVTDSATENERNAFVPSGVGVRASEVKERGAGENQRLAFGGKILEVPKFLDGEFVKRLNGQGFDLTGFYEALDVRLCQTGEPWDLRWIREQFARESPAPERRRIERDEDERPISARERADAERVRRNSWGGRCGHEPKCETAGACIARLVRDRRATEAA